MIELARPTVDLYGSWWEMVERFDGELIPGSAFRTGDADMLRSPNAFALWVDWLGEQAHDDGDLEAGRVACSYRWVLDEHRVAGAIALRHSLTEGLLVRGGHIGYAIDPAARRRGVATTALRLTLALARRRGLRRVLITCEAQNIASVRTIERVGGVLDGETDGSRRYWVTTAAGGS